MVTPSFMAALSVAPSFAVVLAVLECFEISLESFTYTLTHEVDLEKFQCVTCSALIA